jgi:hypothetical protein
MKSSASHLQVMPHLELFDCPDLHIKSTQAAVFVPAGICSPEERHLLLKTRAGASTFRAPALVTQGKDFRRPLRTSSSSPEPQRSPPLPARNLRLINQSYQDARAALPVGRGWFWLVESAVGNSDRGGHAHFQEARFSRGIRRLTRRRVPSKGYIGSFESLKHG